MPRTGTVLGLLRRAAPLGLLALASVGYAASPGAGTPSAPDYAQINLPDKAGAQAFLDRFRQGYSAENLYLEFDLSELPRRGDTKTFKGRMWSARNELGPITRVELTDEAGGKDRYLIQSGPDAALWKSGLAGATQVPVADLFEPLLPGLEMTPFDLQMPFFYWPESTLLSVTRLKGRATYLFRFAPPAAFASAHKELAGVRCYLDTEFAVPVQTELYGPSGKADKTLSLVDVKKVGDLWMVKEVDVRNETTRDKTRLAITAVAPGQFLDMGIFEPARLDEDLPAPSKDRLVVLPP